MASTIAFYTGDGATTDFTVPFDYLAKKFVRVSLGVTILKGGDYGDTSKDYYFLDKTKVRLKVPPQVGEVLTIRRYTSATDRVVSFKDASVLKATDLDVSAVQTIHIAEEARDIINDALIKDKEGNWDAKGNRIVNVGDAVSDGDAVNLKLYKEDAKGAYQSRVEAEKARDRAVEAETNAKESEAKAKVSETNSKMSETVAKASAGTAVSASKHADAVKVENERLLGETKKSEASAKGSANTATAQATISTQKANEAMGYARDAKVSEDNAMASEVAAEGSAELAKQWATKLEATVDGVDYSAKHYANKANEILTQGATDAVNRVAQEGDRQISLVTSTGTTQVSRVTTEGTKQINLATAQANEATRQANLATAKATEAEADATSASRSATEADASAKNSANSASTATQQATLATQKATEAKTNADKAALSKDAAKVSETNAKKSEANAKVSETNAKKSETEATAQAERAKGYADQATRGQVNADWNETVPTSKAFIKNKPTLGTLSAKNSLAYSELTGVPTSFTPSSHTHPISQVTNLQAALDAKASNTDLSNLEAEVTKDLQAVNNALAGKAPTNHTHTSAQVTDLSTTLAPYAKTTDVNKGLAGKANTSHTHTVSQITDMPNVVLSVNNITPASGGNVNLGLHAVATSGDYNDLMNKPSMPATPNAYITETWRDGSNWYRKWSDGLIEQGGEHYGYSHNVTFNTPFSGTAYAISGWIGSTDGGNIYPVMTAVVIERNSASFSCKIGYTRKDQYTTTVDERNTIYWSAVGY